MDDSLLRRSYKQKKIAARCMDAKTASNECVECKQVYFPTHPGHYLGHTIIYRNSTTKPFAIRMKATFREINFPR